jgi:Arc/MetJ-type ribon-helix-helix transcriptional regulator
MTDKAKRMGRPPIDESAGTMRKPMTVRLPIRMHEEIEAIRESRRYGADKSDIVRELLADALEAHKRKRSK